MLSFCSFRVSLSLKEKPERKLYSNIPWKESSAHCQLCDFSAAALRLRHSQEPRCHRAPEQTALTRPSSSLGIWQLHTLKDCSRTRLPAPLPLREIIPSLLLSARCHYTLNARRSLYAVAVGKLHLFIQEAWVQHFLLPIRGSIQLQVIT